MRSQPSFHTANTNTFTYDFYVYVTIVVNSSLNANIDHIIFALSLYQAPNPWVSIPYTWMGWVPCLSNCSCYVSSTLFLSPILYNMASINNLYKNISQVYKLWTSTVPIWLHARLQAFRFQTHLYGYFLI